MRQRRALAFAGVIAIALAHTGRSMSPEADVMLDGVPLADADGEPMLEIVRGAIEGTLASIPRDRQKDVEMVREAVRQSVRAAVDQAWGKRPIVKVLVTRAPR